jgi:hypothetical protein
MTRPKTGILILGQSQAEGTAITYGTDKFTGADPRSRLPTALSGEAEGVNIYANVDDGDQIWRTLKHDPVSPSTNTNLSTYPTSFQSCGIELYLGRRLHQLEQENVYIFKMAYGGSYLGVPQEWDAGGGPGSGSYHSWLQASPAGEAIMDTFTTRFAEAMRVAPEPIDFKAVFLAQGASDMAVSTAATNEWDNVTNYEANLETWISGIRSTVVASNRHQTRQNIPVIQYMPDYEHPAAIPPTGLDNGFVFSYRDEMRAIMQSRQVVDPDYYALDVMGLKEDDTIHYSIGMMTRIAELCYQEYLKAIRKS